MTAVFSALNTENLAHQAWNRTLFKSSSLSLRSIKESSVTSRLLMILKWLFLIYFLFLPKEAEEPPNFKSCSNGMKSVKGQNNAQKHPFLRKFIQMPVWSPSSRKLSCRKLCRWLFKCLKKGKRHVSTQHRKRSLWKAWKLKNSLYLQPLKWTLRNQLSLCHNL